MGKILTGKDIRMADMETIGRLGISSLELMERASVAIASELAREAKPDSPEYLIFAGKGNNGGDGLAAARLLACHFGERARIGVIIACQETEFTAECAENFRRLPHRVERYFFSSGKFTEYGSGTEIPLSSIAGADTVIVDAVLGTGLHGPARGQAADMIRCINSLSGICRRTVAIDLPSGMPSEPEYPLSPEGCVTADMTITVEFPKLSLLLPETGKYAGRLKVVHIGLDTGFMDSAVSPYLAVDEEMVRKLLRPRNEFDNKGTHGHALIIAGSSGMMGAAVLSCGAALKSGCGLVTVHVPAQERHIIHIACPSAIVSRDPSEAFSCLPDNIGKYTAVAAGPGLGKSMGTVSALEALLEESGACRTGDTDYMAHTLVLDADALNIISGHPDMLPKIPAGSVLTPHIGELSRLISAAVSSGFIVDTGTPGKYPWKDDMHKLSLVAALSSRLSSVIVVKGAHTMTCLPDSRFIFNMTGNPGMAKGGSGDVLAGLIAGLAARGYDSAAAAVLGVYFHGRAGDSAADSIGMESMNASDILENIRI